MFTDSPPQSRKDYKKESKKSVEKNYAPNNIIASTPSPTNRIFQARKEILRQQNQRWYESAIAQTSVGAMPKILNEDKKRENDVKSHNRQAYLRRIEEKIAKYEVYEVAPVNISPYLNFKYMTYLSVEERILMYNKRHRCSHKPPRRYTEYKVISSVMIETNRFIPSYIELNCRCEIERKTKAMCNTNCPNCLNIHLYILTTKFYTAYFCDRCKTTTYKVGSKVSLLYNDIADQVNAIKAIGEPEGETVRKFTQKTWNPLPTVTEEQNTIPYIEFPKLSDEVPIVEKELGLSDMTAKVGDLLMQALNAVKGVAAKMVDWVVDVAKAKLVKDFWACLHDVLTGMIEVFMKSPLTNYYLFWRLLTCETWAERLFILSSITFTDSFDNVLRQLLSYFGLSLSKAIEGVPKIVSNTKELLFPKATLQKHDRYRSVTRQPKRTTSKTGRSSSTYSTGSSHDVSMDEIITEEPEVKKESASDLFYTIFALPSSMRKLPTVLEALRSFNTVCSGWKNLHELINNFLQYLPDWLTSIFVATDPRKRYATDSMKKGSPVNDMIEAYKRLYRDGTVESLTKFEEAWKQADLYIADKYPPNEVVNRTHHHYLRVARTVINPTSCGTRPIPFVLSLFGPPGTGKSTSWPVFLSSVVKAPNLRAIKAMSYTRNTSSDYFDGYNPEKHKIFVYDDFGHKVDDVCVEELISIISTANFLPPFGSVDNANVGIKGTPFNSPIVVLNTNFADYSHCKTIADRVALQRRLGVMIHLNEKIDPAKGDQKFEVTIATYKGIMVSHGKMTVKEIQKFVAQTYTNHFEQQATIDDAMEQLKFGAPLEDFLAMYNNATNSCKGEAFADATVCKKESYGALLNPFGCMLLVAYTRHLAEEIDRRFGAIGDLALMAASALGITYATYRMFFAETARESGETHTPSAKPRVFFARPESGNNHDDLINKITQNCVQVKRSDGKYQNGFFLKGRLLLINTHFFEDCDGDITIFTFRSVDKYMYEVKLADCKRVDFEKVDLTILEVPVFVSPYPDITKYLSNNLPKSNAEGYVTRSEIYSHRIFIHSTTVQHGTKTVAVRENDGTLTRTLDNVCYKFHHNAGDCGSLVMAEIDGNLKVVAFHTFGSVTNTEESFGTVLNRNEIEMHMAKFSQEAHISREDAFPYEPVVYEVGVSVNKTQYVATSKITIHNSGETTIIPSIIHDKVVQHTTKPAMLRARGDIDPMLNGLKKYGKSTKQFSLEQTRTAVDSLTEQLLALVNVDDIRRTLTIDEAVNGVPEKVDSMNMATSAGYPHALDPQKRGEKRQFFDGAPGTYTPNDEAMAVINHWYECIERDEVPSDPYIVTLKDERRKIEKVDAGKTRLFCAGSLAGYLINKRAFAGFNSFLQRVRGSTFSTLGMNRASGEWDEMIKAFRDCSPYGFDGDQEEWDGRFKAGIAMNLLRLFDAYYVDSTPFEKKTRRILFEQAIFSYLRVSWMRKNAVILVAGLMPSGWYMTFTVNSLVNAILFRLAWQNLVSAPYNDLYYFREFVREKYAGDDNILAVSPAFLEEFNACTVRDFFYEYDQIYTPATKSGEVVPYQPVQQLSFLKTVSGRMYDRWVPLFDMSANLDTMNWIRKQLDPFIATQDNCNDVLRNLFFYGAEIYNEWRNKMLSVCPKMNLLTFAPLRDSFLGLGMLPDPYGTFGYSRNDGREPQLLYKALQKSKCGTNKITLGVHDDDSKMSMSEVKFEVGEMAPEGYYDNYQKEGPAPVGWHMQKAAELPAEVNTVQEAPTSLDESAPVVTSKAGVHLSEQQATYAIKPIDGRVAPVFPRAAAHLNEPSWDLDQMLERENLISSFPWALTDAVGTELTILGTTRIDVITDLLRNNLVSAPFLRFLFFNCEKIVVRFQITASRFHQGRLIAYYVPSMVPKAHTYTSFGPTRASTVQCGYLDPANGTVLDLEIPFIFNKGWLDLAAGDVLGQIHVQVLNQLVAATGASTAVEVKMFLSVFKPQFKIPRPGGTSYVNLLRDELKRAEEENSYTFVRREGGFAEMGASLGTAIDSAIDIVPQIASIAENCLDKPNAMEAPMVIAHKDHQYMSNSRGAENLERLTLEPTAMFITADQFGSRIDETDIAYLVKKKAFFKTFNWNATDPVGTIIYQAAITPTQFMSSVLDTTPDIVFEPTPLGWISHLFTYWRGGIILEFHVVGTSFHEGRLDVSFHPGVQTVPTDYVTSQSQYTNSRTIRNVDNVITVLIPFLSDTPYKRVHHGQLLLSAPSDEEEAHRFQDFCTGTFSIRVGVPIKAPSNVSPDVQVNMFVRAADDFELSMCSAFGGTFLPYNDTMKKSAIKKKVKKYIPVVKKESGDASDECVDELEVVCITNDERQVAYLSPGNIPDTSLVNIRLGNGELLKNVITAECCRASIDWYDGTGLVVKPEDEVEVKREAGDLNDKSLTDKQALPLAVARAKTYDLRVPHFGESYKNLRELAKRYTMIENAAILTNALQPGNHVEVFDRSPVQFQGIHLALFSMFRLFRGPMRVKYAFKVRCETFEIPAVTEGYIHAPPFLPIDVTDTPDTNPSIFPQQGQNLTSVALAHYSNNQIAEFEIPFNSFYHSLLIENFWDSSTDSFYVDRFYRLLFVAGHMLGQGANSNGAQITCSVAFGDETRVGVFMGIPKVKWQLVKYPNPTTYHIIAI